MPNPLNEQPIIHLKDELVISEEQFAEISKVTNEEQVIKLKCWDVQEYLNKAEKAKMNLETDIANAKRQLDEATQELEQIRTQLKIEFDKVFEPMGLSNKTISISQTAPHIISVHEDQPTL